ncbi:MAG: glycoside hydrolase family 2 protein, partial [Hungatella sp.]
MERTVSLNGRWSFKEIGSGTVYKGNVPGSVLSDLLSLGVAADPYWRTNEYQTKELFRKDYLYFRPFDMTDENLEAEEILLVLEGIDTIGEIFLNGELLCSVNDMHRTYRIPVKGKLKKENEISIKLYSPLRFIEKADREGDIAYASTGCQKGNGALRKAHYMFGWDWGPQLPDSGIFRDVYLICTSMARFDNIRIRQFHGADQVTLTIEPELVCLGAEKLDFLCEVTGSDGKMVFSEEKVWEKEGGQDAWQVEIQQPNLWWPCGYGSQSLYHIRVTMSAEGELLGQVTKQIGLRTITVCTDRDQWGSQFAFVVNGQKIFAMGANYIPEDNIRGRISKERSEHLVKDCARANFNCIRIWGGGYYPDDYFYYTCDK